jgi:hypothetical protein
VILFDDVVDMGDGRRNKEGKNERWLSLSRKIAPSKDAYPR